MSVRPGKPVSPTEWLAGFSLPGAILADLTVRKKAGARRGIAAPRTVYGRMLEEQSVLDEFMGELSDGIRSAHHYEQLEERLDTICIGMRSAFREYRAIHS